jgi:toluene monooxygenase system protein B
MALFPIYGHFIGDFVPHLVAVDTDDTMTQVAEKIAVHSVGRRVPPRPNSKGFEVLVSGNLIDGDVVLGSLGLHPLDWIDVRFRE